MIRWEVYKANDFDDNGLLKAPVLFWIGLIVLMRAWWLTGMAMTTEHEGRWLVLFYPDDVLQWLGLAAGIPGFVMLFCYPVRAHIPGLVRAAYLLMLIAALGTMGINGWTLMRLSPAQWDAGWVLLCLDTACLVMLWPDCRQRSVFFHINVPGALNK